MLPRKHNLGMHLREAMSDRVTVPRNTHEAACRKCFNVLNRSGRYLCNYHGCHGRLPIELMVQCPKGEF